MIGIVKYKRREIVYGEPFAPQLRRAAVIRATFFGEKSCIKPICSVINEHYEWSYASY